MKLFILFIFSKAFLSKFARNASETFYDIAHTTIGTTQSTRNSARLAFERSYFKIACIRLDGEIVDY